MQTLVNAARRHRRLPLRRVLLSLFLAPLLLASLTAAAPALKPLRIAPPSQSLASSAAARHYGARLEGFDYPFPVHLFRATAQGQTVEMAYMELAPVKANGRTIVLLHGKNFCGATWGDTARVLAAAGYRVIVPDQIGFCKSSKPTGFQYSVQGLATLTEALLRARGAGKVTLVGHSMGGLIAMRMAIAVPQLVDQMVLVDPLGLADGLAQGVPYISVDRAAELERRKTAATIRVAQQASYYHGTWRSDYDRWVGMLAGMYAGPGREAVIDAQARTTEMIETQPVASEFARITTPTVLMVGTQDRNVFGRSWAPPEVANQLPDNAALGDRAASRMHHGRFVPLTGLGHVPQVEDPARFQVALIQALSGVFE